MNDTPRTDTLLIAHDMAPTHISLINHSRELERELNAANAKIKRLEEAGDALANHHLLVVTTYDKAKTHVSDWNKAKEDKP